jgi:hypothetical protein
VDYVLGTWPLVSPNATSTDVVGKILYLRQNYHFGPRLGPETRKGQTWRPPASGDLTVLPIPWAHHPKSRSPELLPRNFASL